MYIYWHSNTLRLTNMADKVKNIQFQLDAPEIQFRTGKGETSSVYVGVTVVRNPDQYRNHIELK